MARSPPLTATYISAFPGPDPQRARQRRDAAVGSEEQIDTARKQAAVDGELGRQLRRHRRGVEPLRIANARPLQDQGYAAFQALHLNDDGGRSIRIFRRAELEFPKWRRLLRFSDQGEIRVLGRRR